MGYGIKKILSNLLVQIIIALILGVVCGLWMPEWIARCAMTFNSLFSQFLIFFIPLLIIGLVTPGIADLGSDAGRMLIYTLILSYFFTILAGLGSFGLSVELLPTFLSPHSSGISLGATKPVEPYFTIEIPAFMNVMSALVFSLILGMGTAYTQARTLQKIINEFKVIVEKVIFHIIVPLLPYYIFGLFISITRGGQVATILTSFAGVAAMILAFSVLLLTIQYVMAGAIAKRNPFSLFKKIIPALATAFGTQSSAATIPVTLECVRKMQVHEDVADFVVPMCATVQLAGAMVRLVTLAVAVAILYSLDVPFSSYITFIFMLSITAVAAPGVPGGVVMACIGLMQGTLGFSDEMIALMIATSVATEGISTATSVSGDGAVAVIINAIESRLHRKK